MPRVDFYILDSTTGDARLTVACRLAEKATQDTMRVWIKTADPGEAARLDDLLWTFSQGSFVPHRRVGNDRDTAAIEPVLIGTNDPESADGIDLLINLAPSMPPDIDGYRRIAELVDGDGERRQQGRERFREYRERGCAPDTHRL